MHFLRRSDKERAIAIANGAKFANTKIKAADCSCKESFARVNHVEPASKKDLYRRMKHSTERTSSIRTNETQVAVHENSSTKSSTSSRSSFFCRADKQV